MIRLVVLRIVGPSEGERPPVKGGGVNVAAMAGCECTLIGSPFSRAPDRAAISPKTRLRSIGGLEPLRLPQLDILRPRSNGIRASCIPAWASS